MTDKASLDMPENEDCAFCAYLTGKRPYTVLWREEKVAVLVTREQRGIGHVLVLPTRHAESLLDLRDDETNPLMIAIRDVAIAIDVAMERPGISVWQNNGLAASQKIAHLHFHVAGTLPGGGTEFGDVPELTVRDTAAIADRLLPAIPQSALRRMDWRRGRI